MFIKFESYCQDRKKLDFFLNFETFCHEIYKQNLEVNNLFENVFEHTIINQNYNNPDELLNELWNGFKRFLSGNKKAAPTADKKIPLQNIPHPDPYDFRARNNRELSRSDMKQRNQAVASDNIARDLHNQSIDKNMLRKQAAERTMKIRQDILGSVENLKRNMSQYFDNMKEKNIANLEGRWDKNHKLDVLNQFVNYAKEAINKFSPNVDLMKYHQDADLSGVKSGLGANHLAPQNPLHYGTGSVQGSYDKNQPMGDDERDYEAQKAKIMAQRNRRVVQ